MEDNNAIRKQGLTNVSEEEFNQLKEENGKLREIIDKLVARVRGLENTWMLNRASMLIEVVKCGKFNSETTIAAEEELTNFLFPREQQEETNKES